MPDWRHERNLFFTALAFLTRIPIPAATPYSPEHMHASARYFPIVGMIVGGFGALVYLLAAQIWTAPIAILLSMAATVLLTGAFHEDGFADSCDGFGGGWRREQVLTIMKDSRIGSYAAIGSILLIALKFFGLLALAPAAQVAAPAVGCALIVAHAWSRLLAISYLFDLNYVRDDATGKVKPMATQLSRNELLIAALSATPLLLLIGLRKTALVVAVLLLWRWLFAKYLQRRIGGYTGDCLGCAQQVAEVLIYLVLGAGVFSTP